MENLIENDLSKQFRSVGSVVKVNVMWITVTWHSFLTEGTAKKRYEKYIDFDSLKQTLSDKIDTKNYRKKQEWLGGV